ncbi:MAG: hypothetical protein AAFU78_22915 [Cyanobacteria bacterium J06633_2]
MPQQIMPPSVSLSTDQVNHLETKSSAETLSQQSSIVQYTSKAPLHSSGQL